MQSTSSLKTAWLVTWELLGDQAPVNEEKKVVAVFNARWGGKKVLDLVEQLYIAFEYGPWDKVRVAQKKRGNANLAQFGSVNGIAWQGEVHCGHGPLLHARRVRNLTVIINDDSTQDARWDEVPRPKGR